MPIYSIKKPWRSAMAQGQAIQVLIRAHSITGDQKYLETANKLLNSFFVEVKNGGVTYKSSNGWWYEEYSKEDGKKSRVLNGMNFALFSIYDYYLYTKDPKAKYLFKKGIQAVKNYLPKYEYNKNYSTYDIFKREASARYHSIHILQLNALYRLTGERIFKNYRDRWAAFRPLSQAIRLIIRPTKRGLILFLLAFVIVWIALYISRLIYVSTVQKLRFLLKG